MSADGLARARAIFARFPTPPCAATLGWQLIDADPEAGTIRIGFEAKRDFCNPAGFVQGGFLAAMLDDAMGPAVLVKSGGTLFTPTIDLHVSFLAPALPGRLAAEAGSCAWASRSPSSKAHCSTRETIPSPARAQRRGSCRRKKR